MVRNAPVTSALMLIAASSVLTLSGAALEYKVRPTHSSSSYLFLPPPCYIRIFDACFAIIMGIKLLQPNPIW